MGNTIGTSVKLTVFGESHGPFIGAVLDGLSAGLVVDKDFIASQLALRRPSLPTDTARIEADDFQIVSGVLNGRTTGAPLTIIIPNENVRSADYSSFQDIPRPSHADYAAQVKYHGFQDKSGGGHFSGRVTAAIVASGAICIDALKTKGIDISTHILSCGGVDDKDFLEAEKSDIVASGYKIFPVINDNAGEEMMGKILEARSQGDSLGGKIQTAILGLPTGVGEPWFDSLEGTISKAVFSIGGVKAIEFGAGFGFASMSGSVANDAFQVIDDKVITITNNSGGINGGISNGMPVIFNMAVRPTPSISKVQQSINFTTGENTVLELKGRHDPAIVRRICVVITSIVAISICDMLALRFGTDCLCENI